MRKMMTFMVALAFLGALALPAVAGVTVDGNVKAEMIITDKTEYDPDSANPTGKDIEGNMRFDNVKANLNFNGDVADGVKALVELRTGDVSADNTNISIRQALIELTNLIPNAALRIGRLRIPFAGSLESDDSMSNPLINGDIGYSGVTAVDAGSVGADCTMNFSEMFSATLGIFNGPAVYNSDISRTEANDKMAFVLRGVANPMEALTVTGEYYTSDNTSCEKNAKDDKISAYEIIGQYQAEIASMLTVKGIYGKVTNDDGATKTKPSTSYMGVQGSYDINDQVWVVGRFVKATDDDDDADDSNDEEVTEMAVGGGYNLAENTKVKVQYQSVKTDNNGNSKDAEETNSGVTAEIITAF